MRSGIAKLLLFTALVAGAIALVPAVANADARVMTTVPCVAYADAGTSFYSGSGTYVITDTGAVALSCHLTLVYGTSVEQPTRTNSYGTCDLLRLPSGHAELNCHYQL
ncbi:MAG: hypothetical protein ACJ744_15685 [Gaiellaceae bacterium]|jgi:hypothetical protein